MPYTIYFVSPVDLGGLAASSAVKITKDKYDEIKTKGLGAQTVVEYEFEMSGGRIVKGEIVIPVSNVAAVVHTQ